ncbi:MAG: pyridoxal phosphate-dependent aminotransferase [Chloroflexi bacterium]|nr:pyridoxal phosphate-dependent aminotransferase [Chloroflexota bacterium]MYF81236.1 pyridoxal phosphate-dependent aminotransferase [Chloroflexota bacterium]MYI03699.1 pyridoxal phosphate-dependent aminotransferase [Chloroflexota bacterium]
MVQPTQAAQNLGTETAFEVLARANRLAAEGRSIINLGIGQPDFATPDNIVDAGSRALAQGKHGYTPGAGIPELREAVARDLQRRHGAVVDPESVLITPGAKPVMFFAALLMGEPGAEIMYPNPGFPIYESVIRFSGATPVPIELHESDGFTFDPDQVLSQINERTRLIILNSPANPTGGVYSREQVERLVEGLERWPDVVVLSDEIYSRILYEGLEHTSWLNYPQLRDRLIVLDGWSKTYAMTGWRLGFGVFPPDLFPFAERLAINSYSCPNAATQFAAVEALDGPQEAVDIMTTAFDERRKVIVKELNDVPGVSCVTPLGAFYAFPNISETGIDARTLQERLLEEAGLAVIAGTSFGHLGEGYLRFSYAASLDEIVEGVDRMRTLLANS